MVRLILLLPLVVLLRTAAAQDTASAISPDTANVIADKKPRRSQADPRKALFYSAALPGLGQAYNRKYWKIPIIYGGFIALGYGLNYYIDNHDYFEACLYETINDPAMTTACGYTQDQLRRLESSYRRQRDYFVLYIGLLYALQIVDAHVDAHLKDFDKHPDFQVRLSPYQESGGMTGRMTGASLTITF
jgi:hypothetical protein